MLESYKGSSSRERAISLESNELAHQIVVRASERNAADIKLLDIRELTTIADFFVICTATSTVHVRALVDEVVNGMREDTNRRGRPEGSPSDGWMVVDLEKCWCTCLSRRSEPITRWRNSGRMRRRWYTCHKATEEMARLAG